MTSQSETPTGPEDPSASGTGPRRSPVSFVRRGSRLQGRRKSAWEELSGDYLVDVPRHGADTSVDPAYVFDAEEHFGRRAPLTVEIGSGLGEAITHAALENPDRDYVAIEVYKPGLANTMLKLKAAGVKNVRLMQINAPEALATTFAAHSVDEVWVFFPDPWHKSRHHKRRIVRDSLVPLVHGVLRPGGLWRLATDWSDYACHMREVLSASDLFANMHDAERSGDDSPLTRVWRQGLENVVGTRARAGREAVQTEVGRDERDDLGGWAPRFEGRILTSFEAKAHQAGREIFDLTYKAL